MMSEGQVRQLLATLKATTPELVNAFSGGMAALEMVLEEDQ